MQERTSFRSTMEVAAELGSHAAEAPPTPAPGSAEETLALVRLAQEISLAASQVVSTEAVLRVVLERICGYTHWPVGHVWLEGSSDAPLKPSNVWRLADPQRMRPFCDATRRTRAGIGDGLVGVAVQERRAVWWTDLAQHTEFLRRRAAAAVGLQTGFAFPAFFSNRLVAVFEFFAADEIVPSEAFLEVMAQIGTLVGNVFERRRTESRLAWSETLLRRMTDASNLGFCVVDERQGTILYLNQRFGEMWGLPAPEAAAPHSLSGIELATHCRKRVVQHEGSELFALDNAQTGSEGEALLTDGRTIRHGSTIIGGDRNIPLGRLHVHEDVTQRKHLDKKFRDLLESAPDGMIIVGSDGRIALVNAEAERMFGARRDELVGQPIETLVPTDKRDAHESHRGSYLADPQARPMGAGLSLYAQRSDGTEFPAEISLSPLTTEDGLMVIAAVRDITRRKALERQLSEAVWREQQALGRELHDGLGGALTGLTMLSMSLHDRLVAIDPALAAKAREVTECAQSALASTKDLANGLVPTQIESHGLTAALEEMAQHTASRFGIPCSFEAAAALDVDDRVLATHVFRIAQEALTNAVRHSGAQHVRVRLDVGRDRLELRVEDDGRGFVHDHNGRGLGLHTMQHRAGLIGGTLQVRTRKRGGTTVKCVVKGWLQEDEANER